MADVFTEDQLEDEAFHLTILAYSDKQGFMSAAYCKNNFTPNFVEAELPVTDLGVTIQNFENLNVTNVLIQRIVYPHRLSNNYTMVCPPVREDNPRALASGLSYVKVDKHEFRESFNLFDKENDNRIHVKDMGTVLRSLGLHPTEAELTDLLGTIETEGTGKIEFAEFCGILARVIKDSDPETELTEAFKVFDKDHSGSLSNAELRRIVTTYGEVLNEEEADEMIKDADTDGDGFVDYTGILSCQPRVTVTSCFVTKL